MNISEAISAIVTYNTLPPQIDYTRPYARKAEEAERFLDTLPEKTRQGTLTVIDIKINDYFDSGAAELDAKF